MFTEANRLSAPRCPVAELGPRGQRPKTTGNWFNVLKAAASSGGNERFLCFSGSVAEM